MFLVQGIARRLATHAVKLAAAMWGLTNTQMMLVPEGMDVSGRPRLSHEPVRPIYKDDIIVTVVYLDINKDVESKTLYNYHNPHPFV
ncbi:hypothetical protein QL285_088312 [Trifolium repens]|jgi:hypothetical protein|nr:hypothetical protein QL285_088312 [Trifolium repens]